MHEQQTNEPETFPSENDTQTPIMNKLTNVQPTKGNTGPVLSKTAFIAVGAVVVMAVSFFGGVQYEKGHVGTSSASATASVRAGGGFGGRMGNRAGGVGTVTAVSSSSITIAERSFGGSNTSTTKTYSITSATTVTNSGASGSVSDIQTGDTVFIRTSGGTSTVATSISVGDMMGGGAPGQSTSAGTTDSSSTTDTSTI